MPVPRDLDRARHCPRRPVCGAGYRGRHIGVEFLDDDQAPRSGETNGDRAVLIASAPRAIHIAEPHAQRAHAAGEAADGESEALARDLDSERGNQSARTNDDAHGQAAPRPSVKSRLGDVSRGVAT